MNLHSDGYKLLVRPLLFALPPETAQRVVNFALRQRFLWHTLTGAFQVCSQRLQTELCGLKLPNPVGLAAGFDKDCQLLTSLAALGFGYVTGGTVTKSSRAGNPRPRLLRYVIEQSLINSLGFPNRGLDFAACQLEQNQGNTGSSPVVVSVSGATIDEIVSCHRRIEPLVDATEINISSPNTAGLRIFQEPSTLTELLGRLNEGRNKRLFVKLPTYGHSTGNTHVETDSRDKVLEVVRICVNHGVDAITVANSWPTQHPGLAMGVGGVSGKVIFSDMLRMVTEIKSEVGSKVAINACGGIFTGQDAWRALRAGATTVQLFTGLIYRGPGIVKSINQEILEFMDREGVESVSSISAR